ncbi:MAG: phosphate acyltransferase PlsX [Acidobacteriota bacterium]
MRGTTQIAVDAMGGDYAPRATVEGALLATVEGIDVVLVGDRTQIERHLERFGTAGDAVVQSDEPDAAARDDEPSAAEESKESSHDPVGPAPTRRGTLSIVHASQVVAMEEPPLAVRKKTDSSIRVCARLVREGAARALITAGNTGAAMIAAKTVIGTVPGVDRPALAGVFPNATGQTVVLDVGANVSARAAHLREFAVMGHFYAQEILGHPAPRVGLLSVGEEEGKGTELVRQVYRVLKGTGLNFVGNVEGSDVFRGTVDVIVCDGFVGNVMLKASESLAAFLGGVVRHELETSWRGRFAYSLARPAFDALRRRTDWTEIGAAPLLGVQAGCFIGHGRSSARAIKNAIKNAYEFSQAQLDERIRVKVAELHAQEAKFFSTEST